MITGGVKIDIALESLQRFAFELDDFVGVNPAFDPSAVREMRFVFDRSSAGAVIVDDIGFVNPVGL